ncbi:MarR family transcriptional regulator [Azospirillum sp.]|uniref:MarR family transcriptional regulator n=1 Tax=Azospirillum sp. TaxID=34012 RepID=UPI003D719DB0
MSPQGSVGLLSALARLRDTLDQKPLQYAHVLVLVANLDGISFKKVGVLTDLSKSTVSRIVDWFVEQGLMTAYEIPGDRRNKAASLTQKGREIVEKASKACR